MGCHLRTPSMEKIVTMVSRVVTITKLTTPTTRTIASTRKKQNERKRRRFLDEDFCVIDGCGRHKKKGREANDGRAG